MNVSIRPMCETDVEAFPALFAAQGWDKPCAQFRSYLNEQRIGLRTVAVAEVDGQPAGYATLLRLTEYGPFSAAAQQTQWLPVIVDFNVLIKYQRRGVGTAIMDALEAKAKTISRRVYLGVGLHSGYGPAQRLYVLRGYVPDGSGAWYHEQPAPQYGPLVNDDDLCIYMSKLL